MYNIKMNWIKFFIILVIIGVVAIFLNYDYVNNLILGSPLSSPSPQSANSPMDKLKELQKKVTTPTQPLRNFKIIPNSYLTVDGTINQTNIQRTANNLPPLKQNKLLNSSAQKKLQDMFDKQYFAHDSPTGVKLDNLVDDVGYEYITVGENLALGDFLNDKELVQAWMDSPGHRANILNNKFTEIGVAVGKGMYEGRETWIAVQHFGKPLSDCPSPDKNLKDSISNINKELETIQNELAKTKTEIESSNPQTEEEYNQYNQKVNDYNNLVAEYNSKVNQAESMVQNYNSQIDKFNKCAQL